MKVPIVVRNILFACILLTLALASGLQAETNSNNKPSKLTLKKALKIAFIHNQEYKVAIHKLNQAKEKVNATWGMLMPSLESEASLLRQHADSGFMSLSDGQEEIRFVQLGFGVNPGVFYHSLQQARKGYTIAKQEVRRIRNEVEYNVIKSYFNVLLAAEMIDLRRDSMGMLRSNLKDVNNLYRTGSVPKFELLQAEVKLKSLEPLLLEAQNRYSVSLDTFNFLLGNDRVMYTVDDKVLAGDVKRISSEGQKEKTDKLTALALKNRPEIIQLEKTREIAGHEKDRNSSYYLWPTISLGGYYGMTKYSPNEVDLGISGPVAPDFSRISGEKEWQNTWQVRLAATYRWGSLLPTDPARARERGAKHKLKEAMEELSRLRRGIAINIRSGYSNLLSSYLTIVSQKENVKTAEEGLRIARESYRAGVIKNSDLLSAEVSLSDARTNYINALYKYYTSLAGLKQQTGVEEENRILEVISQ